MKSKFMVSVVVPMYNVERFIDHCLHSIRQQTYSSYEVIVIDDGSADHSLQLAMQHISEDHRFRLIEQVNSGVSVARNSGIEAARGEYVCFIDADDWIDGEFLERLVSVAESTKADMVISEAPGNAMPVICKEWSRSQAAAQLLVADIPIGCWNKLYRRDFLNENSIQFRSDLYMGEGLHFITMCVFHAERITAVGPIGYHYRRDNTSSATSVPSVAKMKNALFAISEIENAWASQSDSNIHAAILYQRIWTLFGALVDAQALNDRTSADEFSSEIRSLPWTVPFQIHGSLIRRIKALGICLFPNTMAAVALRRRSR